MKEAAGEANLTVIAIILIGVVAAVMTPLVNSYLRSAAQKSCCTNFGGFWDAGESAANRCRRPNPTGTGSTPITVATYYNVDSRTCIDE